MIFNITGGGSGAALNFKIVGSTTEPANPAENTIWVNTDTEITGWNFSATQPENMIEGEVWFQTDITSPMEFDALKKNSLYVYPMSAMQYVDGALVGKDVETYRDGGWVSWWDGVLYMSGEKDPRYTKALSVDSSVSYSEASTYANIKNITNYDGSGYIRLKGIDLTRFSKLCLNVSNVARNYGNNAANATASLSVSNSSGTAASMALISGTGAYNTFIRLNTLDISKLEGLYDINIGVYTYNPYSDGNSVSFNFNKLYLEA